MSAGLASFRPVSKRLLRLWTHPEAKCLCLILVLATALRVAWVLYAARAPVGLHDPTVYYLLGHRIGHGFGYSNKGLATAYFPVGYPAALGGVFSLIWHTPIPDNAARAAGFFNTFISVATVGLAYIVGRQLFNAKSGLLAALWLAIFPNLIFHTGTYLSETLFSFFVMAALAVIIPIRWKSGQIEYKRLLIFGALLGLSALVRPISLLFLPLLPGVWIAARSDARRALAQTALVVATTAAVIAPWTVRNIIELHAPIVISSNLGDDLCIGHHPGATGRFEYPLPEHCFAGYEDLAGPERETRRNQDNIEKAITFAVHNPSAELGLIVKRARGLWDHDHDGLLAVESYGEDQFIDPQLRSALVHIADVFFVVTMVLAGLGLIGLVLPPRVPHRVFFLLALLTLATVPLAFFGEPRFHMPVVPLAVIPAAWLALWAWNALRETRTAR